MIRSILLLFAVVLTAPAGFAQEFPFRDLMPVRETHALQFLEAHPEYDGRGVLVAIFDTGVDPGAPGLQVTPDGKPKFIDFVDATGSGDVSTTTVRKAEEGKLTGLSGRSLTVPDGWMNPSGEYHLGLKRAYDLFPAELVTRIKRERKEAWDAAQRARAAELRQQIEAAKGSDDDDGEDGPSKKELEARLKVLEAAWKEYDDPGPVLDCVVFHDGEHWRAALDTDEDGDLGDETALANYRVEHRFASFSAASQLNFSVNIFDEGRLLSIVSVCGDHGTHVAGIVGAHYPEMPERSGMAPGVQFISVKIGDHRLDGMETGTGLVRGIQAVLDHGCDLINMSYGEPSSTPNHGRLVELFSEAVDEHGVIFVASAGNAGPALTTVGAPGGTTSALLGIGAYVSPELMTAEYALRKDLPGLPFTWTSRAPTADGDWGVDLFAPGAAVTSVPPYTLQPSQRMNGTSMASPNACGGIALLLSGLKAQQISYTPYSIRRAVQNTAQPVEGVTRDAQGPGLLQVDAAFEHLTQFADVPGEGLQMDVRVDGDRRGVYLRESQELRRAATHTITVSPHYPKSVAKEVHDDLELPLSLTATADWINVGQYLLLTSGGARFEAEIDPTGLEPGVHFAEIVALDSALPERGPIFRVPVTVVQPQTEEPSGLQETLTLKPGEANRIFLDVPAGATWADLTLTCPEGESGSDRRIIVVHAIQLLDGQHFEEGEFLEYVPVETAEEVRRSFAVSAGRTLELCVAQYWSSLPDTEVQVELTFRGLTPSADPISLPPTGAPIGINVSSAIRRERCAPSGELTTWRRYLSPDSHTTRVLPAGRDSLPEGRRMHQLALSYKLTQAEDGNVTISIPRLDGLLYDSPVDGERWLLVDSHNRVVAAGDMFAAARSIVKGDYTLKLELRHTDPQVLEGYEDLAVAVDRSLEAKLAINATDTRADGAAGRGAFTARWLEPGDVARVWLRGPSPGDLPDDCRAGDVLLGTATFVDSPDDTDGAASRPGGFPVEMVIATSGSASEKSDAKPDGDELAAELARLKWPDDAERFTALAAEHPEDRSVLVAKLHAIDNDDRQERLADVVAAADAVISGIDRVALAAKLGRRADPDDKEQVSEHKESEKLRDTLADALYRKGRALGYMELPEVIAEHPIEDAEAHDKAFEDTFRELARWVDTTGADYYLLHVRRDRRRGDLGQALELLSRHKPDEAHIKLVPKKRRDMYGELGWGDWRDYEAAWMLIRFPEAVEPF